MDIAVTDFPEPDSPTKPTISFSCIVKLKSFTAAKTDFLTLKFTDKLEIFSSGFIYLKILFYKKQAGLLSRLLLPSRKSY